MPDTLFPIFFNKLLFVPERLSKQKGNIGSLRFLAAVCAERSGYGLFLMSLFASDVCGTQDDLKVERSHVILALLEGIASLRYVPDLFGS